MTPEINYSQAPHNYTICLKRECPQASTCLRQLMEQSVPADIYCWAIISPKYLASLEGTCPYYRSSTKVRYAKGFIKLLEALPHKQMQIAISHLIGHFSRRTYYRIRKGERLLSPTEQQKVMNILKNCGVTEPKEFDAYVYDYEW
ncbi:DUF6078 family protein [Bacteroides sp. 224]|uniref:DUF6078 family protein n=1 Tax=Bacteroides sp. 224 TaxID=2302936 RepID=UPI0013D4E1EE|nr:DUF6078 family protein [Bacteroides sp. 224]NDV64873.1 hypothetical protein [Bacteroides sp. 224]